MTKMMANVNLASIVKWLLICGWLTLFIGGVTHYSGSWVTYVVFSLVFLAMLLSGLYRQVSYGYLFLVVMLWLGFWLKVTVHLLVDYPFGEPLGLFSGTPVEWDEVLRIASIGCSGVLVARLLHSLAGAPSTMNALIIEFKAPTWYKAHRCWIWTFVVSVSIGLAIANAAMGIQQSGLVARTILLWPLNALIYWLLVYGLAFAIATLLWWDISLRRNISSGVHFALLVAFTSTVSLLSRGIYIFQVIPQLFALYRNRKSMLTWSRPSIMAVAIVFAVLFATSNFFVNTLRGYYYSGVTPAWALENNSANRLLGGSANNSANSSDDSASSWVNWANWASSWASGKGNAFAKFAVDRWIGAEGVMAVAAYPNRGMDIFTRALVERGEVGKYTIYQDVCMAHYRQMDMSKFQFASLPGAIGFLYFTGYWWVVAIGMVLLTLAVLGSEVVVFKLTSNPLLCALWGGAAANAVAQMGIAPRGLLTFFFEMSFGIAAIAFIQSKYFAGIVQKLGMVQKQKSES